MREPEELIRAHIRTMPTYVPISPLEVLSERLGLDPAKIVKLDANENPYGPLPGVAEVLASYPYHHIYPDPESRELRKALAKYHAVPFENLLVGAGADELIDLVMRLFLEPGDGIVNCPPAFGMYPFDAGINNGRVISIPRCPDLTLDLDGIEQAVRMEQPKLLFVTSPNNPDGGLVPPRALERLLELPLVVVLDEAYVEFAPPGTSHIKRVAQCENLIVLRTFSKWAGLAGLRVGYGVFPSSLMTHLWKMKQPYNVSVAAAQAAIISLQHADALDERRDRIVAERERLYAALLAIPWLDPHPSHGNFVLCRVIPAEREGRRIRNGTQLQADLARRGVMVRSYRGPFLGDHIRVSVGRPEHTDVLLETLGELE